MRLVWVLLFVCCCCDACWDSLFTCGLVWCCLAVCVAGDLFGFADLWLNSVDLCSLFDVGIAGRPVCVSGCSLLFGWWLFGVRFDYGVWVFGVVVALLAC